MDKSIAWTVLALLVAAAPAQAKDKKLQRPVRVYVTTNVPEIPAGDFVDPSATPERTRKLLTDSVRDIQDAIVKRKNVIVVPRPEGAEVVLEVTERSADYQDSGRAVTGRDVFGQIVTQRQGIQVLAVIALARVGAREPFQMVGTSYCVPPQVFGCGTWGGAAKALVEYLDRWALANEGTIRAR